MNFAIWMPLIFLWIVIFATRSNQNKMMQQLLHKKKGEKNNDMRELAKNFIGKEVLVYAFNTQIEGTVKAVTEGAILLEKAGAEEAINLDFVVRLREYPRNKNGKKKSVVLD